MSTLVFAFNISHAAVAVYYPLSWNYNCICACFFFYFFGLWCIIYCML